MQTNFEFLLMKKLLGTITAAEEADFNLWLKANPAYAAVYEARQRSWTEAQAELDGDIAEPKEHTGSEKKRAIKKFFLGDLIALVAMLTASLLFYQGIRISSRKISSGDMVHTLTLNDGTQVSLKPNSQLVLPKSFSNNRTVNLQGQAYFKVKKGSPIVINAGHSRIEASDASFVVLTDSSTAKNEVVVFEGRARLSSKLNQNSSVIVTPGRRGRITARNLPSITYADTLNMVSWKTDKLTFRKATLYDVAATISEYYNVDVHVHEGLTGCPFTATFNQVHLDEVLAALQESIPVKISRVGRTITLDGENCGRE